jgi:GTP-binding protein
MLIRSVQFAGAIGQVGQPQPSSVDGLPQLAFSGRSNVGKSSLINRFLGRTRTPVARVSQTPGKTREINFFLVNADVGEFVLVDLPGYGYARASGELRERWGKVLGSFMSGANELRGVVQLIDIRHGPTEDDVVAIQQLQELEMPTLFVLTKADKLKTTRRQEAIRKITSDLGLDPAQIIASSSTSGMGMDELRAAVAGLIASEDSDAAEDPVG